MSIEICRKNYPLRKSICVLISGKAGYGKTTLADILVEKAISAGYLAKKYSFAGFLKDVARAMYWDGKKDDKGRKFLQDLGRIGRDYDQDMWVRHTFEVIENHQDYPFDFIVIDDWRFPNELDYIKKNQFLYSPLTLNIKVGPHKLENTELAKDISETSLDNFGVFDGVVYNTGTIEDLNSTASGIFEYAVMENTSTEIPV